ncbi:MAG: aldo/keto reductase [Thermoguttaceae bacterium]|nr:aldo/keto reductase [Thermoguttaceae bacterium]
MEMYTIMNGVAIPKLGFGTWQLEKGSVATKAVRQALEIGYRHIDAASAYNNEENVGQAVLESGLSRNELFITTKLWNRDHGFEQTIRAFEQSLLLLQTDYVDLYLIHWPIPMERRTDWKSGFGQSWEAMIQLYEAKKIRAIGVCNCRPHHLEYLIARTGFVPMVNQIEFHPGFWQKYVVDWCVEHSILIQAWSPLAQQRVFELPLLKELSGKYNRSLAQICLRWEIQKGVSPIPKSATESRIRENFNVFDFSLTPDEVKQIDRLPECGATGYDPDDFIYPS